MSREQEFTNEPCPACKEDGDGHGFIVKRDCDVCRGTGYKPTKNEDGAIR